MGTGVLIYGIWNVNLEDQTPTNDFLGEGCMVIGWVLCFKEKINASQPFIFTYIPINGGA